jgi:tetratricopeptide (TPR) repeat protein
MVRIAIAALVLCAQDPDAEFRRGVLLLKNKQNKEAVEALRNAVRLAPANPFVRMGLTDAYLREGSRAAALEQLRQAEANAGRSIPAWKGIADLHARMGGGAGQIHAVETLVGLAPAEPDHRRILVSLLLDARQSVRALAAADAALLKLTGDAELLRLRGLALYALGRKTEAIGAFLAAMDKAPDEEAMLASAETLIADAGEMLPALAARFRRFHGRHPNRPVPAYLLALVTEPAEKERLLRAAIASDSRFWPAWFELSKILATPAERKHALETTIALAPNHEAAHFALAQLFLELGDREKARLHRAEHHRLRTSSAAR